MPTNEVWSTVLRTCETKLNLEKNLRLVGKRRSNRRDSLCLGIRCREAFMPTFSLKKSLKRCENKPEVVDKGFWYLWVLNRLGLKYKHETFGRRNSIESLFSQLKERTKRFHNRFPFNSSFDSVQSWLESFMVFYNYWRWLC